jgi:hypothetical protein
VNSIDLLDAARAIQDFCDSHGWSSCLFGGIAVQRWSQARVTRDVDLTLLTGFGGEASFIEVLLSRTTTRGTPSPRSLRSGRESSC